MTRRFHWERKRQRVKRRLYLAALFLVGVGVVGALICLVSCESGKRGFEGPLWEREGGVLNPWG